jgi:two-component system, cell cycle response regulator
MQAHSALEREDTQPMPRAVAPAHAADAGPRTEGVVTVLRGPNAGALFTLEGPRALIGRSSEAEVLLRDGGLSRRHALITRDAVGYIIEDLGSTNGTFLNGQRLIGPARLEDGARVEVGEGTLLRFGLHDAMEQAAARRTHELTVRDPLTRLLNKAHVSERLDAEVAFCRRHNSSLSVLMVDVDEFKKLNDQHGHHAGDVALRVIAHALERTVRTEDVLGRFGGEEFAVLARGIGLDGAVRLADRLCEAVRTLSIPLDGSSLRVTVSVGVAHSDGEHELDGAALLQGADVALYAAKHAGRNRYACAPRPSVRERKNSGTRSRVH